MAWEVMQGDVIDKLLELPDKHVQTVVTSPPYWGLRSYLPDNHKNKQFEIGLEPTPELYVQNMVQVFREVRRVLRDDGCLWLNLGDSYCSTAPGTQNAPQVKGNKANSEQWANFRPQTPPGLKPKDLVGIPWRVALALQADGWYLRSGIPWLKNSAMPESVTDRPSTAVEYFFLLSKSQHYFYDADAVRIKHKNNSVKRNKYGQAKAICDQVAVSREQKAGEKLNSAGRNRRNNDWFMDSIRDFLEGRNGTLVHDENGLPIAVFCNPQPYPEAHFATFSPRLITPMILAGTSPMACEKCGAPWERVVEKEKIGFKKYENRKKVGLCGEDRDDGGLIMSKGHTGRYDIVSTTLGWQPTCTCENEGTGRCIVLDPFAGSGTTLWVAEHYGRDSIGIELSEEYVKLIYKRMDNMQLSIFNMGKQS